MKYTHDTGMISIAAPRLANASLNAAAGARIVSSALEYIGSNPPFPTSTSAPMPPIGKKSAIAGNFLRTNIISPVQNA